MEFVALYNFPVTMVDNVLYMHRCMFHNMFCNKSSANLGSKVPIYRARIMHKVFYGTIVLLLDHGLILYE